MFRLNVFPRLNNISYRKTIDFTLPRFIVQSKKWLPWNADRALVGYRPRKGKGCPAKERHDVRKAAFFCMKKLWSLLGENGFNYWHHFKAIFLQSDHLWSDWACVRMGGGKHVFWDCRENFPFQCKTGLIPIANQLCCLKLKYFSHLLNNKPVTLEIYNQVKMKFEALLLTFFGVCRLFAQNKFQKNAS